MMPLDLRFLYATPLRGVAVMHEGSQIRMRWSAGATCAVMLTPNIEGDIALLDGRHQAISLRFQMTGPASLRLRTRVRGAGWLFGHTELWQDHELAGGESDLRVDTLDFRICQNEGAAAHVQCEWVADQAGELTLVGVGSVEQTVGQFFAPRVDRFGQRVRGEWAGKVHGDAELTADAALPLPPPMAGRDRFGGRTERPRFKATGRFRTERAGEVWWLVTPEGAPFLSLGPCCVGPGTGRTSTKGREELFAELPDHHGLMDEAWASGQIGGVGDAEMRARNHFGGRPESTVVSFYVANLIRKWGKDWFVHWVRATEARLRHWGMNTLACWSDLEVAEMMGIPCALPADRVCRTPFSDLLPGPQDGPFPLRNVPDVFHPDFKVKAEGWFLGLARYRLDPNVIGYFVDNEEPWCSWQSPFSLPERWESRRVFVSELESRYGTIARLNAGWGTAFRSFAHLNAFRHAENPPGLTPEGTACCDDFMRRFTDRYFGTVRAALAEGDPKGMFLGCRFLALPPRQCILDGAAPHMDVVSINWYLWHKQKPSDAPDFLGHWHRSTGGKPLMISEYSFAATDERGLAAQTLPLSQPERARLAEEMTRQFIRLPFVVGAHWFLYMDEPLCGRNLPDGERGNFGLVDVVDRPYVELTAALQRVSGSMYEEHGGL